MNSHEYADKLIKTAEFLKSKEVFELLSKPERVKFHFFSHHKDAKEILYSVIKSLGRFTFNTVSDYAYFSFESGIEVISNTSLIGYERKVRKEVDTYEYDLDPELKSLQIVPEEITESSAKVEE